MEELADGKIDIGDCGVNFVTKKARFISQNLDNCHSLPKINLEMLWHLKMLDFLGCFLFIVL